MAHVHGVPASHDGRELSEKFYDLFAISYLYAAAIKPANYRLTPSACEMLALSDYGHRISSDLQAQFHTFPEAELKQVFLQRIYHKDLFLDWEATNIAGFQEVLSESIRSGELKFPWVFGYILYRRANDIFADIPDELKSDDVEKLLSEAPKGVFQLRNFLVGPYGILNSLQRRHLPPTTTLPLWHCSDPECVAVHDAKLRSGKSDLAHIRLALTALNKSEKIVHWDNAYRRKSEDADYYDIAYPCSLPSLLGNAFSDAELRRVVKVLLDKPKGLRSILAGLPIGERFKGSSEVIARSLSIDECLQLILLCQDKMIIDTLERLIGDRTIVIPASETRKGRANRGWFAVDCQASSNGIRFKSTASGIPSARLKSLLTRLYPPDNSKELDWRLKYLVGNSSAEKLDRYVEETNPDEVIREQILLSGQLTERAFELLGGAFDPPKNKEDDRAIIDRIMWKLGFDVPQFPINYRALDASVSHLKKVILESADRWAQSEVAIRGSAVNFFVSAEHFLNDSLSFSAWALLSDHYKNTKFEFNSGEAHRVLASELTESAGGEPRPGDITFRADGKNTLFPLCRGFRLLAELCRLTFERSSEFLREKSEYPNYAGHTSLAPFPFVHTKLILDVAQQNRESIFSSLISASADLEAAGLPGLRNRIEHSRNQFPERDELLGGVDKVVAVTDALLKRGLSPATSRIIRRVQDTWGREKMEYENYRGDVIAIPSRSNSLLSSMPREPKYAIFAPCIVLDKTQETLRFSLKEDSEYATMMHGIPIRRPKPGMQRKEQSHEKSGQGAVS